MLRRDHRFYKPEVPLLPPYVMRRCSNFNPSVSVPFESTAIVSRMDTPAAPSNFCVVSLPEFVTSFSPALRLSLFYRFCSGTSPSLPPSLPSEPYRCRWPGPPWLALPADCEMDRVTAGPIGTALAVHWLKIVIEP